MRRQVMLGRIGATRAVRMRRACARHNPLSLPPPAIRSRTTSRYNTAPMAAPFGRMIWCRSSARRLRTRQAQSQPRRRSTAQNRRLLCCSWAPASLTSSASLCRRRSRRTSISMVFRLQFGRFGRPTYSQIHRKRDGGEADKEEQVNIPEREGRRGGEQQRRRRRRLRRQRRFWRTVLARFFGFRGEVFWREKRNEGTRTTREQDDARGNTLRTKKRTYRIEKRAIKTKRLKRF